MKTSVLCLCLFFISCSAVPTINKTSGRKDDRIPTNARIVNGEAVINRKEFPFVVDISESDVQVSSRRFCTGTLIDHSVVLTAAHCVINAGYRAPVYATIGRVELEDGHKDNEESTTYRTVASVVHPQYSGVGSEFDVAVLLLNASHDTTVPVTLSASTPDSGTLTWVVGYGIQTIGTLEETGRPIKILAGRLQKSQLRIVERSQCDVPQVGLFTSKGLLCTKGIKLGASACMGDSGGGLFKLDPKKPQETTQVGIVSYGDSQCASEESGVFTDVSNVLDWIMSASQRLHSISGGSPMKFQLDDSKIGMPVIHDDHLGGKSLEDARHKGHNLQDEHNINYYEVITDFSHPTDVKISLCDSVKVSTSHDGTSPGASLSARVVGREGVIVDKGSCADGKLSELTVKSLKKDMFTVGVSSDVNMPIRLTVLLQPTK